MSGLLLLDYPRVWFLHWWESLRQSWWRITVLVVAALLPLAGFWRDELGSSDWSRALHVAAIIVKVPTSWLIIFFLCVLLVMTVEGTANKAIRARERAAADTEQLQQEIISLRTSLSSAQLQLQEPRLAIEIIEYEANEVRGPVTPLTEMAALIAWTNDQVLIRVKLRVINDHRAATSIMQGSLSLKICDLISSWGRSKYGSPTGADTALFSLVNYAQPIEGWASFRIDNCTAMSIVKDSMIVSAKDGKGVDIESKKERLTHIKPQALHDS